MLDRNWMKRQFQGFLDYICELFIRVYAIMPDDNVLLALPNGTRFRTLGYHSLFDGFSGIYVISDNYVVGARKIRGEQIGTDTNENPTYRYRYLSLANGGSSDEIDVCRWGIKPDRHVIGSNESIATAIDNSEIMNMLLTSFTVQNGFVLKFPSGRFYFKDPINLVSRECHIKGAFNPRPKLDIQATGGYANGTVLVFPSLTNGQSALLLGSSSVSNVTVFGNPATYDFQINRDGALASKTGVTNGEIDSSNVITETIGKGSNNEEIHCYGIKSNGANVLENVVVAHFYNGMWFPTGNTYITNVHTDRCHTGISIGNDTKLLGAYGWGVHTLIEFRGSISSACQVRVDDCVNVIHILGGNKINITDVDGDWCTDSVILIGDSAHTNTVNNCVMVGIHGRCNMLSGGFDRRTNKTDIREVSDTTKYGIIRVANGCGFRYNYVVMDSIGGSTYIDGAEYMRTPTVALTFESLSNGKIVGNHFSIRGSQDAINGMLHYTYDTAEDIKKAFMLGSNNNMRIDTGANTFYVTGNTVRSMVDNLNEVATSMDGFKALVLASSDFADLQSRLQASQ